MALIDRPCQEFASDAAQVKLKLIEWTLTARDRVDPIRAERNEKFTADLP